MQERAFISQLIQDLGLREVGLILSVFDEDIDLLTGRIAAAAAAGDAEAFRRAAHSLAGAAGAVGAAALEQACRAAMQPGCAPVDMQASFRHIQALSTAAAATLRAIMAEHPIPPARYDV